jgi:NAD(P)-dependent dehydrogenase (short-subunit alcohol dehydrogenase family)
MEQKINERESAITYKDLRDKVAIVTGGATGIGLAIASAFAASGSKVVIIGRNKEQLEKARKKISGSITAVAFDLTQIDRIPDLVRSIESDVGGIDILVNNAGINLKKDAIMVSNEEFESVIKTNETAVFALTREVGKAMVTRHSGSIIMISSMASQYGIPKVVAYTASKAAVEGMTRALAVEWSPHGVRVNCIAPGFIATDMSARALENDPDRKQKVLSRTPMGRLGMPEDVAKAALFLASDSAGFITGVVLPVDGGNSIGF